MMNVEDNLQHCDSHSQLNKNWTPISPSAVGALLIYQIAFVSTATTYTDDRVGNNSVQSKHLITRNPLARDYPRHCNIRTYHPSVHLRAIASTVSSHRLVAIQWIRIIRGSGMQRGFLRTVEEARLYPIKDRFHGSLRFINWPSVSLVFELVTIRVERERGRVCAPLLLGHTGRRTRTRFFHSVSSGWKKEKRKKRNGKSGKEEKKRKEEQRREEKRKRSSAEDEARKRKRERERER